MSADRRSRTSSLSFSLLTSCTVITWLLMTVQEARPHSALLHTQVEQVVEEQESVTTTFPTLLLGGHKTKTNIESLGDTTYCRRPIEPLPVIRFAASGCYFPAPSPSLLVCGGRQDLFSLSSSCWRYSWDKSSWSEEDSLPVSVAGAATVCSSDKMMMVGGVVEEDYYQDTGDYYDYTTEVATAQVLEYDVNIEKWEVVENIPEPRQGACGVSDEGRIILTGGKNDKECGYGSESVWYQEESSLVWRQGPSMNNARFHHACMITSYRDDVGVMVLAGLGPHNDGDSVEFLSISGDINNNHWILLPRLSSPHPNQPIAGHISGLAFLIGGGGFPYPGGEDKAEILTDSGWEQFKHVGVDRSFGTGIQVPSELLETCSMVPNFGHHHYFRRQGEKMLESVFWFCDGDTLITPLETGGQGLVSRCTVPGCQYYQIPENLLTRASLNCAVDDHLQSVSCQLQCSPGFTPRDNISSSSCDRLSQSWDKTYLECQQH